jgi:hypothetical protein
LSIVNIERKNGKENSPEIALAGGPIKIKPLLVTWSEKLAFSDKNPYPG